MSARTLRYLTYLGYVIAVTFLWSAILFYGFDFFPVPHEPVCRFQPNGCPPPSFLRWVTGTLVLFGSAPISVLGLVMLRRRLHKLQNLEQR
jgi:hypothetical protein